MVHGTKVAAGCRAKCNRSLFVLFVECLGRPDFSMSFNAGSLNVNNVLCWVHASTVAPTRAIIDELTEKNQLWAFKQLTTGFAVNETWCWESSVQSRCGSFCACPYLFSRTLKGTLAFCTSFFAYSEMFLFPFGSWMEHLSFRPCWRLLPDGLLLWRHFCGLVLPSLLRWRPSFPFIRSHLWAVWSRKGCHCPYATWHWQHDWLCCSDSSHAFISFERASRVWYASQLRAPHLSLDHDLGELKMVGSCADSYALL